MDETEIVDRQLTNEEYKTDSTFLQYPQTDKNDSMLSKHLQAEQLLEFIEKLLMGYERDDETGEYKKIEIEVQGNDGNIYKMEQGPLIDPNYVRLTIGYLKTFLNSNTFLSYMEDNRNINNIMWDVVVKLTRLLHPLKKRYPPETIDLYLSMIENTIFLALNRAYRKNTLDAMTKMQHSIEHLNATNPNDLKQKKPKNEFKVFGF